jgi:hypothetical protein
MLAPPEKAGTRTICPKCLKPLTVPAVDREAAVDLEQVLEPVGATAGEISLSGSNLMNVAIGHVATAAVTTVSSSSNSDTYGIEIDFETYNDPAPAYREPPSTPAPQPSQRFHAAPPNTMTPPPFPKLPGELRSRKIIGNDIAGMINLTPTGMFGVDAVSELSAALSMRMQPPPEPATDQLITNATWYIVTVGAVCVWVASVLFQPSWFVCVAALGAAVVAFGLAWQAYLAGRNGQTLRGIVTLLPPLNVMQLFKPSGEYGRRPLRFVLTGLLILGMYFAGPQARGFASRNLASVGFKMSNS